MLELSNSNVIELYIIFDIYSVPPKRVAVAVETPTTSVVPNTRPAPPRAPPATTPTASPTTTPTAPTATNKVVSVSDH